MRGPKSITVQQLQSLHQQDTSYALLDVREDWEIALARLAGAMHIPLNQLEDDYPILNSNQSLIVFCHHGIRSLRACVFLTEQGFKDVLNLSGGIDAWARQIDPAIGKY